MIDTHAHLDMVDDGAVERARAAGVTRILTIGMEQAVALAESHDGVHAVVGVDPHEADRGVDLGTLRRLLAHPRAVAVGEIGLDYFRGDENKRAQQDLFAAQMELADELGKPIVVHTRAADGDTERMLRRFRGTVVLHCFSEPGLLNAALECGWYLSFAGNVTYRSASDLRAAAVDVPADRLLAETDSPYLAPQPVRGQRNEPAYVMHTLAALAEARGDDVGELEAQIDRNASACFGL